MMLNRTTTAIAVSFLLHIGMLAMLAMHAAGHEHAPVPPKPLIVVMLPPPPALAAPTPATLSEPPSAPPEPVKPPKPVKPQLAAKPKKLPPEPASKAIERPVVTPVTPPAVPTVPTPTAPIAQNNLPPAQAPTAPTAATAPAAPGPSAATGVSIPASYASSNRKPVQPPLSRRYGEQGTVVLRVLVRSDGNAGEVQVRTSSGYPLLDEAARSAVQDWRFIPATRDGKPVTEWYLVPVTFTIKN